MTRYLGRKAPKFITYLGSAIYGFVLAVCPCTIMPLFTGIYKQGADLGSATNILALAHTSVAIGMDIVYIPSKEAIL